MPRKVKEPPRAVFTLRQINVCELEKPRSGLNKEWISELNAVEERIKNVSMQNCFSNTILSFLKNSNDRIDYLQNVSVMGAFYRNTTYVDRL